MVREAIGSALPKPRKKTERPRWKLKTAVEFADAVLEADRKAPRKQRHTAHRIWERIQCELPDCKIGERTVRQYVHHRKIALGLLVRETCVPQSYTWGVEAQVDWYEAEVLLLRDELANVAWGIERTVCGPLGRPLDRTTAWNTSLPITPPPSSDAVARYRLGSHVPDYWIPFLPLPNSSGVLKLKRGKLPESAAGPLGTMFGYPNMTVFLEEVPREGVLLEGGTRGDDAEQGAQCASSPMVVNPIAGNLPDCLATQTNCPTW